MIHSVIDFLALSQIINAISKKGSSHVIVTRDALIASTGNFHPKEVKSGERILKREKYSSLNGQNKAIPIPQEAGVKI